MTTDTATAGDTGTPNSGTPATADATTNVAASTPDQGTGTNAAASAPEGTETKADGQSSNPDGTKGDTPAVPETYEFKMPEGVDLDTAAADEFSAIAKELKLSQADAQRIADVATKMQQKQAEAQVATVKGWADQCKTDKEFGGDNLEQNMSVARKAIDTFGSPELKALLNTSGLGNHPEVVRFAFKAGKAISEDTFVKAGARVPTPDSSLEKRLYPDMN